MYVRTHICVSCHSRAGFVWLPEGKGGGFGSVHMYSRVAGWKILTSPLPHAHATKRSVAESDRTERDLRFTHLSSIPACMRHMVYVYMYLCQYIYRTVRDLRFTGLCGGICLCVKFHCMCVCMCIYITCTWTKGGTVGIDGREKAVSIWDCACATYIKV